MRKNRGRLEIIADILGVIEGAGRAKKTQIMYQANLSYNGLQRYLKDVLENSLVCFVEEANRYILTKKGLRFLRAHQRFHEADNRLEGKVSFVSSKKHLLERLIYEPL